jgi:beta-glucosidase
MIARRDLLRLSAMASLAAFMPASLRAALSPSRRSCHIAAPRLSATRIAPNGTVGVEVDVSNPGRQPHAANVQLFVHDQVASVPRPALRPVAARSVTLRPGESRTLRFSLGAEAFRLTLRDGNTMVEPGLFDIMAGSGIADLKSATLEIA